MTPHPSAPHPTSRDQHLTTPPLPVVAPGRRLGRRTPSRAPFLLALIVGLLSLGAVSISPYVVSAAPTSSGFSNPRLPSLSADGAHGVVIATGHDGFDTVLYLDVGTGDTRNLVETPEGRRGGDTAVATISGDGCVVAAITQVGFDVLRDDDTADRWDVYSLVLPHCGGKANDWKLVSTDDDGAGDDHVDQTQRAVLSADGSVIAYVGVTNIGPIEASDITIVDATKPIGSSERTATVLGYPTEAPTAPFHYLGADQPTISADGNKIAFRADFNPRTGAWLGGPTAGGPAAAQVFVWDRTDDTVRNGTGDDSVLAAQGAAHPALSGDGSTLVFVSGGEGFSDLTCEVGCEDQVFALDLDTDDGVELVSVPVWGPTDNGANGPSRHLAVNFDGSVIAFVTDATNLTATEVGGGGTSEDGQLIIATPQGLRSAGSLDLADDGSVEHPGGGRSTTVAPAVQSNPALSATGGLVLYESAGGLNLPTSQRFELDGVEDAAPDEDVPSEDVQGEDVQGEDVPSEDVPSEDVQGEATDTSAAGAATTSTATGTGSEEARIEGSTVPEPSGSAEVAAGSDSDGDDPGGVDMDGSTVDTPSSDSAPGGGRQLGSVRLAPRLELAQLDFGSVQRGEESAELYASVVNRGPTAFAPVSAVTTSEQFAVTGGSCTVDTVVAAGESCTVRLTYTPQEGDESGELVVTGRDGGEVRSQLFGSAGVPLLRIDPAGVDLGTARLGEIGERAELAVTNLALDSVEIDGAVLEGRHSGDFTIADDKCAGMTVEPQQQCKVVVEFRPTATEGRTATLVVRAASEDYAAAVIGGVGVLDPVIMIDQGPYASGDEVSVIGTNMRSGAIVWVSVVGHRDRFGPFQASADGALDAVISVPDQLDGASLLVAVDIEGRVLTSSIQVELATGGLSYLPGYGTGLPPQVIN